MVNNSGRVATMEVKNVAKIRVRVATNIVSEWQPPVSEWQPIVSDWQPPVSEWQPIVSEWQQLVPESEWQRSVSEWQPKCQMYAAEGQG